MNLCTVLDQLDVRELVLEYLDCISILSTTRVNKELYKDSNSLCFNALCKGVESWLGECSIQAMLFIHEKNCKVALFRLNELVPPSMYDSEEENIQRRTWMFLDMLERVPRVNDNTSRHLLNERLSGFDEIKSIHRALQDNYMGEGDPDSIDSVGIGYVLSVYGGNQDNAIDFFFESNVLDIIGNSAQLEIQCLFYKFGYPIPTPNEINHAFQVSEGRYEDAIQYLSEEHEVSSTL